MQTTQMMVVRQNTAMLGHSSSARGVVALAGLCFFGIPFLWRFRRNVKGSIAMLILVGALGLFLGGCSLTSTKTYTITVTGTSLPLTHSVNIQLHQ